MILVLAIALVVFVIAAASKKSGRSPSPKFQAQAILTQNETEFFQRLRRALPEEYIFPQVAMSALIRPVSTGKARLQDFGRISQKRVDYAVYTPNLQIVAVVELDDRTHNAARDSARDAYLLSAGVRTVRFQSSSKPNVRQIRDAVYPAQAGQSDASSPSDCAVTGLPQQT
jgi:very-short-patch-repair endonuclease